MDSGTAPPRRHHLLIGGTGRAGTSFLVRYLTALGLDTTLARQGEAAFWDEAAHAGLEEPPALAPETWPYVVKTPWAYQFIAQLLADGSVALDAVILPVRPLHEAAASRVILELRDMHAAQPWLVDHDRTPRERGLTAGGCIMSLEPLDQARLLAVAFHDLIEMLVRADVPVILLAFPRLAEDADYLFGRLAPLLPGISPERAREVHARLADPAKIRVGRELLALAGGGGGGAPGTEAVADFPALDAIALRRELGRVRSALADATARADHARMAADHARAEADQLRDQLQQLLRRNEALAEAEREADRLYAELNRLAADHHAVLGSLSWRATAPVRRLMARAPAGLRRRLRRLAGFVAPPLCTPRPDDQDGPTP
jgi:ElaB/YqjD/DUF883 family membrane-anchored ribosome-binding protein